MRIGFIGLGRMGANMVRRLLRDGHEIVAYNRTPEKTREIEGEGALAAFSIAELVEKLEKPRAVWVMVPAGDATEAQIRELLEHLEPGDTIIDGGNTNFHDDVRRHGELQKHGINYVDAGTSGGIWGLQVGYCLMVGGDKPAVDPLEPVFTTLAPEGGYMHVGGPGAGHYVKMVHNGIEYGLMQAYAEGFEIMHASDYGLDLGADREPVGPGVGRALVAAGAAGPRVRVRGPGPRPPQGLGRRLRRGSLDRPGGDRPRRPGPRHHVVAADPLPLPPGRLLWRQGPRRAAQRVRRPRGQDGVVGEPMDLATAMATLEAAGTEQNRKTYRRHGARDPMFGVSFAVMRPLAKRAKRDQALARELWAHRQLRRPDPRLHGRGPGIHDRAGPRRLAGRHRRLHPGRHLRRLAGRAGPGGPRSRGPMDGVRSGLDVAGRLGPVRAARAQRPSPDDGSFSGLLERIEAGIHGAGNRTRHSMNGALIAIGARNERLRAEAEAASGRIGIVVVDHGETGCVTPAAVPYIARILGPQGSPGPAKAASGAKEPVGAAV